MISMNTSNTFRDCDLMFIPDWMVLDELVKKTADEKNDILENLLANMSV